MAKETKVTHITASDAPKKVKVKKDRSASKNIFVRFGRYLKGAWHELKLVRWPNRKETWGLTAAVLLFSAFFLVLILGLDALFQYLFKLIIR